MKSDVPHNPKIYHIVHIDRLTSIIADQYLLSDAMVQERNLNGTTIGMTQIKERRLLIPLTNYPNLCVGACVPFYFCPRSIMLYMFFRNNHSDISYVGGQDPIIHLIADLGKTVAWAETQKKRWVFTDANAGSYYFNDFSNLSELSRIDWNAVQATSWHDVKEAKQAEFLIEERFPWELVEGIGVYSMVQYEQVNSILESATHRPPVKVLRNWYY
jgi:hypothetical protein